jgi:hypothetical protein
MVQVFPMPLAEFWSPLRVASLTLSLPAAAEMSRTAGGEIIVAELGARLWTARVTLAPANFGYAAALQVKLRLLQRAGATLFVSPRIGDHPARDPNGVIAASNLTIYGLPAGNQTLSLAGLPAGYALPAGDYLAFNYGNPAIQAFHQMVGDARADASGVVPAIGIVPQLRPGATIGASVTLVKPAFRALLVPGSLNEGVMQRTRLAGISFDLIQTLKA